MLTASFLLLTFAASAVVSNFYGSMSGYACNQPSLYQACACQSFCQPYINHDMHYSGCGSGHCGGHENSCDEEYGCEKKKRRKHKKKKNKKKKFRFSEEDTETPKKSSTHDDEEFPLPPDSEEVAEVSRKKGKEEKEWEDDDKWESKFVSRPAATSAPVRTSGGGGGLGGLGLGTGGLFGISSGVGVGVPGVGPIGVSSGLGIG